MEPVGEHPVPAGPLAVRWLAYELPDLRAGTTAMAGRLRVRTPARRPGERAETAGVCSRTTGSTTGGTRSCGTAPGAPSRLGRAAGDEVEIALGSAPQPPGRYRLSFDVLEEFRFWWSDVGSSPLELAVEVRPRIDERRLGVAIREGADERTAAALAAQEEPLAEQARRAVAHLVAGAAPAPDWSRRTLDALAEGYAAVGGAIESPERARARGRPAADATPPSSTRCSCRRSSSACSRWSTPASPPTCRRTRRGSSTAGSGGLRGAAVDPEQEPLWPIGSSGAPAAESHASRTSSRSSSSPSPRRAPAARPGSRPSRRTRSRSRSGTPAGARERTARAGVRQARDIEIARAHRRQVGQLGTPVLGVLERPAREHEVVRAVAPGVVGDESALDSGLGVPRDHGLDLLAVIVDLDGRTARAITP